MATHPVMSRQLSAAAQQILSAAQTPRPSVKAHRDTQPLLQMLTVHRKTEPPAQEMTQSAALHPVPAMQALLSMSEPEERAHSQHMPAGGRAVHRGLLRHTPSAM